MPFASALAGSRFRVILCLFLAVGGACNPDEPIVNLPPVSWEGEHVRVATDLDIDSWCVGTLPRLDHRVGALKGLFEAPEGFLVDFYLYPPPVTDHACAEGIFACYDEGMVFASDPLDTHEIVHAVSDAHGKMPHFFEEGAASYWGFSFPADLRGLNIRTVLKQHWTSGMDSRGYALAAHFTSFLIDTYGLAPYVIMLKRSRREQSREEFEETFKQGFGLTLDEAIDAYEANWPYCDVRSTQRSYYECDRTANNLPPGVDTYLDVDVSCENPEVVGPSALGSPDGAPRLWWDTTVELETKLQDIWFEVPALGEPNSVVVDVKRCDTRCDEVMRYNWRMTPQGESHPYYYNLSLEPGRYIVRVSRAEGDPGPVRIKWRPSAF